MSVLRRIALTGLAASTLATGLVGAEFAGSGSAHAATAWSQTDCDGASRMFQLRSNGTELWMSSITAANKPTSTVYSWAKVYTFGTSRPALAVAAHQQSDTSIKLFATDSLGGLRSLNYSIADRAVTSTRNLASGTATAPGKYKFDKLTSNGRYLFGTKGSSLFVMTSPTTTAEPAGMAKVDGWSNPATAFFGNPNSPYQLGWTDSAGNLHYSKISSGADGWKETSLTAKSEIGTSAAMASPGAGIVLRKSAANLMTHLVDNPGSSSTQVLSATASTTWNAVDLPITTAPNVCVVDTPTSTADIAIANAKKVAAGQALDTWKGGKMPYSWGGGHASRPGPSYGTCSYYTGPQPCQAPSTLGVDCSGFVRWMYFLAFGYDILGSGNTDMQVNDANTVKVTSPKPGDLVYFGTAGNTHHVGLYIGDGKMINAPRTNTVVREDRVADFGQVAGYYRVQAG